MTPETHKTVGVCPTGEWLRRAKLFGALEDALPVRFEGRRPGEWRGLDAVILLENQDDPPPPSLRALVTTGPMRPPLEGRVVFGSSPLLDARLRGRSLIDSRAAGIAGLAVGDDTILASCGSEALWTRNDVADHLALAPEELGPQELLRDGLVPGRWLGVLPLIHFLREVAGDLAWREPATRASFIIDDPNLHWPSYGHVRFRALVNDAVCNGYHVAFATIPLDGWLVHPGVARLFRENQPVLSLLVHGNDHLREELSQPRSDKEALALLAQALQRVAAVEERAGVSVSRLMVAPHGRCTVHMMRAMLLTGFEGLCYSWRSSSAADRPLTGWEPADLVAGGFPVFPRLLVTNRLDDLVLRSFLAQPVILYAHHWDLAEGLDVLAEAAAFVNDEAGVRWESLSQIARSNYLTRRDGRTLRVRPFARRMHLEVPDGVEQVVVELPRSHGEPLQEIVAMNTSHGKVSSGFTEESSDPLPISGRETAVLSLSRLDAIDLARVDLPSRRLLPILRRAATEGRDRLAPPFSELAGRVHRALEIGRPDKP